jgi:hypothetical protein
LKIWTIVNRLTDLGNHLDGRLKQVNPAYLNNCPPPVGKTVQLTSQVLIPAPGVLEHDAENEIPRAILVQLRREASAPESLTSDDQPMSGPNSPSSPSSPQCESPSMRRFNTFTQALGAFTRPRPANPFRLQNMGDWKEPELYEVMRAVERKDIMFLMEVRDKAFHVGLYSSAYHTKS